MYPGLNERQQQIMEMLSREGEVRISQLKEHFPVTEMTLRRDLEKLEQIGVLKRTFGGAISITQDIRKRSVKMMEEKIRIGKKAAESVQPGESIFIDGGTTALQVAKHLPAGIRITVVTHALNAAHLLVEKGIRTIVTGGIALETTSTLVGPLAVEAISRMAFDRAFIGASGCSVQHGFSNSDPYESELKKMAIERAVEANIVIDHTKFGQCSLVSFADLSKVHGVYTDRLPDDSALLSACKDAGVRLIECE